MSTFEYEQAWQRPAPAGQRLRVHPGDVDYARLSVEEAQYYATPRPFNTDLQTKDGPVVRHINLRMTGDQHVPWFATLQRHGTFRRGLALGSGGHLVLQRILSLNPALHLTICDVSEPAVEQRTSTLTALFPGRVSGVVADLNFQEWEEASYDCIISDSTLHHVINIEHVAREINKALTTDGFCFISDYTGETRFEWADAKRRLYETFMRRSYLLATGTTVRVVFDVQRERTSPLCGVRSADTLDVLAEFLEPVRVRQTNALMLLLLCSRVEAVERSRLGRWQGVRTQIQDRLRQLRGRHDAGARLSLDVRSMRELLLLDDLVTDAGLLVPCNAFGVYRKRG